MLTGESSTYNLTNLQSCYDRQLPNFMSIIKESIGIEWASIKLFTKVLPVFKHYIYTSYSISTDYYRGQEDLVGGTGQRIKLPGNLCRDKSCLIINIPEQKQLGVIIESLLSKVKIQELCIGFVNDTDFITAGNNFQ